MSLGVSYQFRAVDKISRVADKISNKITGMDAKFLKLGRSSLKAGRMMKKSFRGMRKGLNSVGAKLGTLAFAGGAVLGIKSLVSTGLDFEDSMAAVAAITGAAGDELKLYSDSTIRLSKKYGVSAAEIATGLKDIASGKSELLDTPDALIDITDKAVELARAAGISVPEAVNSMVNSLNQFGKGAEKAASFADILTQGSVSGASEITDTAEAMKNAGSIASAAGLDFLETNAAIQAMSKSGLKSAEAGTGLAGVIRIIGKKLPGLSIKDLGFEEVLRQLTEAEGLGQIDLQKTFGLHAKSILGLTANFEHFKRFKKELGNASGATKVAADIRMATTRVRLAKAKARLDQATLKVFSRMEPMITKLVEGFSNWADSLNDSDIERFSSVMTTIVDATLLIGKGFGKVYDVLESIGTFLGETLAKFHLFMGKGETAPVNLKDFSQKELNEIMRTPTSGTGLNDLSSQLPDGSFASNTNVKTEVEITMKGNTENIQKVTHRTTDLGSGRKRKSKVKSNMGT